MKLHPRVMLWQAARADIGKALGEAIARFELTHLELLQILNEEMAAWIKYGIRSERHPDDPEKPGGLE
jgi:hypothetical protein